jgi:hypothetical protein
VLVGRKGGILAQPRADVVRRPRQPDHPTENYLNE